MLVYRVELEDGTGPWCNPSGGWHSYANDTPLAHRELTSWACPSSIKGSIHNKFSMDPKGTWRFGFIDFKQFFKYCMGNSYDMSKKTKHRCLSTIQSKGMSISVYEIDDSHVMADDNQCVFRIGEARLIERLDALSDTILEQLNVHCT